MLHTPLKKYVYFSRQVSIDNPTELFKRFRFSTFNFQ